MILVAFGGIPSDSAVRLEKVSVTVTVRYPFLSIVTDMMGSNSVRGNNRSSVTCYGQRSLGDKPFGNEYIKKSFFVDKKQRLIRPFFKVKRGIFKQRK